MREVQIPQGRVRLRETGQGPPLLLAVDPPNVLEQHAALCVALRSVARVVVFEPPGFGHSAAARGHAQTLDAQADATIALLDKLALGPVTLALPCVGAFVALRVAARRPDLVARIVTIQAPAWDDALRWVDRVDAHGLLRAPLVGPAVGYVRAPEIAKRWYRAALPTKEQGDAFGLLAVEAFDHGARFPLAAAFRALERSDPPPPTDLPVLSFWGEKDRTHARSDPEGIHKHAPRAKIVRFADAGHFPELEEPRRFAEEIRAWLAQ
jgi:pimeloyl-ACP methyl ester carboxylesterase